MTTTDAQRLQIARIVAEHWWIGALDLQRDGEPPQVQSAGMAITHAMTVVLKVLDGATEPTEIGVTGPDAARIRAIAERESLPEPLFAFAGHLYVRPIGRGIELIQDGEGHDGYDWEHSEDLAEALDSLLPYGNYLGGYVRNVRITVESTPEEREPA